MIIFVDYEHKRAQSSPWAEKLMAARTRITYRLEDLSGEHCMLVRYDRITPELVERLDTKAIFISGNGTDPSHYDKESLLPLQEIVRARTLPMFGFCGGFQFIADALGSAVVSLEPEHDKSAVGEASDDTADADQPERRGPVEFGYMPIDVVRAHPVLDGITNRPVFRHAHSLHVPEPPAGFNILASTDITPVQLAIHDDDRIVGTQFHPEYWTDEHPEGETMIANFLRWSGVTR